MTTLPDEVYNATLLKAKRLQQMGVLFQITCLLGVVSITWMPVRTHVPLIVLSGFSFWQSQGCARRANQYLGWLKKQGQRRNAQ